MSSSPTVVVKKGGVLTALVSGVFGTLIVCIVCGAAIGLYALNVADRKFSEFVGSGKSLLAAVPELRESLAVVTDMLNDRRAPEYRQQLDASVRIAPAIPGRTCRALVVEVVNRGPETVTFLTARVVAADESGVPLVERRTFVATPVGFNEDEWRGPLLPGSTRRFTVLAPAFAAETSAAASIELTDLRVWNRESKVEAATPVVSVPATP